MKLEICYYPLLLALSGSVRYLLDPTILQYGYIAFSFLLDFINSSYYMLSFVV
jgi:hypothetical protein